MTEVKKKNFSLHPMLAPPTEKNLEERAQQKKNKKTDSEKGNVDSVQFRKMKKKREIRVL
jgi:hypothetical protein